MNTGNTLATVAFLAGLASAPALAVDHLFDVPQGCEAYVSAQLKSCQVSHHFRCENDAPGDQWTTYVNTDGPSYTSRIDDETRWMQSFDHIDGVWDRLDAAAPDHASFTALIDTGVDDYDFSTTTEFGEKKHYRGYDRLSGGSVRIDGVALERTEFEIFSYDTEGTQVWRRKGMQFISREWRIFFADHEVFENAYGDRVELLDTPVDFAFPGEAGFLSMKPQFGCEQMMTQAPGGGRQGS